MMSSKVSIRIHHNVTYRRERSSHYTCTQNVHDAGIAICQRQKHTGRFMHTHAHVKCTRTECRGHSKQNYSFFCTVSEQSPCMIITSHCHASSACRNCHPGAVPTSVIAMALSPLHCFFSPSVHHMVRRYQHKNI